MILQSLDFISGIMKPATDLVDELITTDEERLQLRNALKKLEMDILVKDIEIHKQLNDLKTKTIIAEINSDSWLSRSWRPITMLTFLLLIVFYVLGWVKIESSFAIEFLNLVKIGLGGYVIGRSAEKTTASINKFLDNKNR